MTERILSPRLTDIVEAIEHIRSVMSGVPLEGVMGQGTIRDRPARRFP